MTKTSVQRSFELSNLTSREVLGFLKLQVPFTFIFRKPLSNEHMEEYDLRLGDRILESGVQQVKVSRSIKNDKGDIITMEYESMHYAKLLQLISGNREATGGTVSVLIGKADFQQKEQIIAILGKINPEIIESCVFMNYRNFVYSIVNKPKNGNSDKLYFYEQNNSILTFSEQGPMIIYSPKINSIEDLLCV